MLSESPYIKIFYLQNGKISEDKIKDFKLRAKLNK